MCKTDKKRHYHTSKHQKENHKKDRIEEMRLEYERMMGMSAFDNRRHLK